jgi:hypothetical protein
MKSLKKVGLFLFMGVLGATLAGTAAHAQSGGRITVTVPFDFMVGNSTLKAGPYRVEKMESGVVGFNSLDGQTHQFVLTAGGTRTSHGGNPYLVFNRYGSEAFLSSVTLSEDDSFEMPRSDREKELAGNVTYGEYSGAVIVQPVQ